MKTKNSKSAKIDNSIKIANQQPLADKIRPQNFSELIGQEHLLSANGILTKISNSQKLPSIILWGNPGTGKTTIAKILARISNLHFEILSATNSGVNEIRKIFQEAIKRKDSGLGTILIIDEIHRFSRSQQDLFLPYIEDGTIILIGATTENPSFELNSALLSRCRVIKLKPLSEKDLEKLLARAEGYMSKKLPLTAEAREELIYMASGDSRYLLNLCEELFNYHDDSPIDSTELVNIFEKRASSYDKDREEHHNLISALHKSMRGSDVDAALYYLARMMIAGENPYYILRRVTRFASEDIGMADPDALTQVLAAKEAYEFLGSPEGDYAIANAVIYCANAPKSNACYVAYKKVLEDAKKYNAEAPPFHILNAPTQLMKNEGYGQGYIYDHDTKNCFSGQEYFPDKMLNYGRPSYYKPNPRGFEREITKRMNYWQKLRQKT